MSNDIKTIMSMLIDRLKAEGFKVQKYEAFSTNSVYLKLDYGVANSIRISDHKGKKHLSYRYNVICDDRTTITRHKSPEGYDRFYYPAFEIERLIKDILKDKKQKMSKYGIFKYIDYMNDNKEKGKTAKGFWQQAVEV